MDDTKDIHKKDNRPHLIDNKTLRIEVFGTNVSALRAYTRAERIASAVHFITKHVDAKEPSRTIARKICLDLLSTLILLKDEMRNAGSPSLDKALGTIRTLISMVRMLSAGGYVSLQNSETLVEALDELGNFLASSHKTGLSESMHISREDLFEKEETTFSKGQGQETRLRKTQQRIIKDTRPSGIASHVNGEEKRIRSERIVGMLTSQGQLGIKDIAASLPEYSEKMIQRELKQLVSEGKVKKAGSKRWSTYVLA